MKHIFSIFLVVLFASKSFGQAISLNREWKFKTGDDMAWANPNFEDSTWVNILPVMSYEKQGFEGYAGYSWYRISFSLPEQVRTKAVLKKDVRLNLSKINGTDEVFLNGIKVAETNTPFNEARKYVFAADNPAVRWEQNNVIAIRVKGKGGMYAGDCGFDMAEPIDYIKMNTSENWDMTRADTMTKKIFLTNTFDKDIRGSIQTTYWDSNGKRQGAANGLKLKPNETLTFLAKMIRKDDAKIEISFTDMKVFKQIIVMENTPKLFEIPKPK
jgi:alpha-galactosidase